MITAIIWLFVGLLSYRLIRYGLRLAGDWILPDFPRGPLPAQPLDRIPSSGNVPCDGSFAVISTDRIQHPPQAAQDAITAGLAKGQSAVARDGYVRITGQ